MNKNYQCICGKCFTNSQAINSHKGYCEQYLRATGKYESVKTRRAIGQANAKASHLHNCIIKKQALLDTWISEKHVCEKCGKIMTEKYGSGRFCSKSCANSRIHSEVTKNKIAKSLKQSDIYCDCCHKKLTKHTKYGLCYTCLHNTELGKSLLHESISKAVKGKCGGLTRSSGGRSKRGWYKGYWCDSTWELVWIIFNLDHNISFERCPRSINYSYTFDNKVYRYYPDFILADGTLIEIKGYHSPIVDLKTASVTDRKIYVLYKTDLEPMFKYVKNNYKYDKLENLYESKDLDPLV